MMRLRARLVCVGLCWVVQLESSVHGFSWSRRTTTVKKTGRGEEVVSAAKKGGFGGASTTTTAKKKKKKASGANTQATSFAPSTTGATVSRMQIGEEENPSFMGSFMMDEAVVDGVMKLFEDAAPVRGVVSTAGGAVPVVDTSVKDSYETSVPANDPRPEWKAYLQSLKQCAGLYVQDYPYSAAYGAWSLTSRTNIQRYPPSGGYKTFHTERTGAGEPEGSRHLVFMTYLNDVTDQGGTEFFHQNVTIQPVKGLTLIWPADWTFTHRGVPSPSQEKTITTGWFNFLPAA